MPDTTANQAAFRRPRTQRPGGGLPIARLVAVFGLGCGSVVGWGIGRYPGGGQGETSLLAPLRDESAAGEVVLADRYFSGYGMIARVAGRGAEDVGRGNANRRVDFRRGRRLGAEDHVVTGVEPKACPVGWAAVRPTLDIREVRVVVRAVGFRVRKYVVVTTRVDPVRYPAEGLAELYRDRWLAELNIRSRKTAVGLDVLRGPSPDMVRKEIAGHFLVYNLIRGVMAAAARSIRQQPRKISFAGACTAAREPAGVVAADPSAGRAIPIRVAAAGRVGDRPNRAEPRAHKRRPKPRRLMTQPRHKLRQRPQRLAT